MLLFLRGAHLATLLKACRFLFPFKQRSEASLLNHKLLSNVTPRSSISLLSKNISWSNFARIYLFLFPDIKRWHYIVNFKPSNSWLRIMFELCWYWFQVWAVNLWNCVTWKFTDINFIKCKWYFIDINVKVGLSPYLTMVATTDKVKHFSSSSSPLFNRNV